jgi:hypothetical protein
LRRQKDEEREAEERQKVLFCSQPWWNTWVRMKEFWF